MPGSDDAYFDWLVDKLDGADYICLFEFLHSIEFVPVLSEDLNRSNDGAYQRWIFHEETGEDVPSSEWGEYSCSVLEMMSSVSDAMHDMMYEPDNGSSSAFWFHILLDNLKLYKMTDAYFYKHRNASEECLDIVEKLLNREYDRDGIGSMFPMPGETEDMRNKEIWYQMNSYCDRILIHKYDRFEASE